MNTRIWLIRFTDRAGTPCATVHTHNAITDFLTIDPAATVEEFDALALSDLLAACRRLDTVVEDTRAHHEYMTQRGFPRIHAPVTRELAERYVQAEMDRVDAMERCTPNPRTAILKNNTDLGEVAA